MDERLLDDFEELSGWTAITSGQAQLRISQGQGVEGNAMRLDFDFRGGGGFVVARKLIRIEIPESYTLGLHIRGFAPNNAFEFKLVDETNENVWRYRVESFDFPGTWEPLLIRGSQIDFAWGPLGGGPPGRVAAVELVIAAGQGGSGTIWIDELWFRDDTYHMTPVVRASSSLPGHDPQNVVDRSEGTNWRSEKSAGPQWLLIDFLKEREFGALVVQWEQGLQAGQFDLEVSDDEASWLTVFSTTQADTERSYLYLPKMVSRYVRINLRRSVEGRGFGVRRVEVKTWDFSRTIHRFFENMAKEDAPGRYPKYFLGRQTHWTTVGVEEANTQALLNEEGMVEVDKGSFSIEPFVQVDGRLFTWADVNLTQGLTNGYLPLPYSEWRAGTFTMKITAFAAGKPPLLYIGYRIESRAEEDRSIRLFAAIRPFQVTPTWQQWKSLGGVSPIRELSFHGGAVRVNGDKEVIPLNIPAAFGVAPFAAGGITKYVEEGELPPWTSVRDEFGYASGALTFDMDLEPGSEKEVFLAIPFGPAEPGLEGFPHFPFQSVSGPQGFESAARNWQQRLETAEIHLPAQAREIADTLRTCAAHILINRNGPAFHPGPRRYSRSWIRDGAIMGAALLRAGIPEAMRDFIGWYAGYQRDDGNIPDCTGLEGPEWLPEFDAYGEFVYAVVEYYRLTGDRAFLAEMEPAAMRALAFMEGLRSKRLTAEYLTPDKRAFYGLLPESMSHEGYMAHPVHSYWDDFWGVRGLRDGAFMAKALGRPEEAARLTALWNSFSENVRTSLAAVITRHGIDYVPGSVELVDFDPTSTAIAIGLLDEAHLLPPSQTANTFDRYVAAFRKRARGEAVSNNYTAYEIRNIGALVRLGWRREALELAEFMLADRRIPPWNQWPEISWLDPSSPSFIGDMPHTWISAEYILAVCALFAYERQADQSLVIAAGVAEDWLSEGFEVRLGNLPTYYGKLSYNLHMDRADTLYVRIRGDLDLPAGGIVVKPPLPRPARSVRINGRETEDFRSDSFVCTECPAEIVVKF